MHAYDNQLCSDDGTVLATFSRHWPAVAALIVAGSQINEERWPLRPQDGVTAEDMDTLRSLSAAGVI